MASSERVELGYALSSEEHAPLDLVAHARRAEESGFTFALVSDHFHPWIDAQGQSPFVWSVLGGIAVQTERLRIGTGVTCPMIRMHPAIVAQAAATSAAMLPGRFFLGVGTGENLNEHVLGDRWPPTFVRREMLREAVEVMRELWQGELTSHRGTHYTVENARLYTLPEEPPEIMVAASGPKAAELAGEIGDGLVATAPDRELVSTFDGAGGSGQAEVRAADGVLGGERGRGDHDGARGLAERRPARHARPGAAAPEPFRAGGADGEPRGDRRGDRLRPGSRRGTAPRSRSTSTPASTTSTCTRSAPTRTASSDFYEREILPSFR